MKDLFSVKEKTVVITGGSSGIGVMIANGFIQNGAKIYITSRKAGALESNKKIYLLMANASLFNLISQIAMELINFIQK